MSPFNLFLLRFAVCDQCILIEDNIKKAGKNIHEREVWQKAKKIHREYVRKSACGIPNKNKLISNKACGYLFNNCLYPAVQVQLQQGMYMYHCAHCTHDKDCMHTTVDGAHQTAFALPHFNQDDKCTSQGLNYKVSITHLSPACTSMKLCA